MKTFYLILIALIIKIIKSAPIFYENCVLKGYAGHPEIKFENNPDIISFKSTKLVCHHKILKVELNFIINWPQSSFQENSDNFNEAAKNYFNDLSLKIFKKLNLSVVSVESKEIYDEEIEIILKFECGIKSLRKVTKIASKLMKNFRSNDLMIFYHEAGIVTSVNTDLSAPDYQIYDYTVTTTDDENFLLSTPSLDDYPDYDSIVTTENPKFLTILPETHHKRFERDENAIYSDESEYDVKNDSNHDQINKLKDDLKPHDDDSGPIPDNLMSYTTQSIYFDDDYPDDNFDIIFLKVNPKLFPTEFVADVELQIKWHDDFEKLKSENFLNFKNNFKKYVEISYNINPKYSDSKISVNVERISKVYDFGDKFNENYIIATFLLKIENIQIDERNLKFDESDFNIWNDIFEFFDIEDLKGHLGDYPEDGDLVIDEVGIRIEDGDEEWSEESGNEELSLSIETSIVFSSEEEEEEIYDKDYDEEDPVEVPSKTSKNQIKFLIYLFLIILHKILDF